VGRPALRLGLKRKKLEFVAINDISEPAMSAHLLQYDSVYGRYDEEVKLLKGNVLQVGKSKVKLFSEKDPAKLPWKKLKVDVVLECSGRFTDKDSAMAHIKAGANKVIISAPATKEDATINVGVNDAALLDEHTILSNASCTTNSLSPVVKVLEKNFGVVQGMMDTIHSYTNDQRILDLTHEDPRRARAAALNIIPSTTGATKAAAKVVPSLEGKMEGMSFRVPTPVGSITNFVCVLKKPATVAQINGALKRAAATWLKGIMEYSEEDLVSSDIIGNPHSSIVDGQLTQVNGKMVRVCAWYDNEWGFTNRLVDLAEKVGAAALRGEKKKAKK